MTADYQTIESYLISQVGVREAMAWRMMLSEQNHPDVDGIMHEGFSNHLEEADHILAICAPTEPEDKSVPMVVSRIGTDSLIQADFVEPTCGIELMSDMTWQWEEE